MMRDELKSLVHSHGNPDCSLFMYDKECELSHELVRKYGFGYCGELTKSAYMEAKEIPEINAISVCSTSIGEHALLVLGENINGQWSADAVICDCWAKKCYPMHQLEEMKKPEHDVKYARDYYDPRNLELYPNWSAPAPYLAGKLEVQFTWRRND